MSRFDLSGLWLPLVTPFDGGRLDLAALARLVERLSHDGATGFVACGSTGEAALLDDDERLAVLRTVRRAAAGRPVLMGLGGSAAGPVCDELLRSAEWADGFLIPPPLYVRPPQRGVQDFFATLADASPKPVVLYDIPARTGTRIARETALALAAHPRIVGLKDCGGVWADTEALIDDGRLQLLAGDDANIFATLARGGAGAIAASAHVGTPRFVRLIAHVAAGELAPARALWRTLSPWIAAAFDEPNPAPVKAALALRGALKDELRAPMAPAGAALRARIEALLPSLAG